MKPATKLFTKAIIWEFILALMTCTIILVFLKGKFDILIINMMILVVFLLGTLPLIPLVYWLGEKVNWTKITPKIRIFCGILLQFSFLMISFSFPFLLFAILLNSLSI